MGTVAHQRPWEARGITRSLPLGRERIDILHGISFRIERGEFVAIIGPSGSGKSTVLGIIAGLDSPTGGQVFVDGVDITKMGEAQLADILERRDRHDLPGVQSDPDTDCA